MPSQLANAEKCPPFLVFKNDFVSMLTLGESTADSLDIFIFIFILYIDEDAKSASSTKHNFLDFKHNLVKRLSQWVSNH